MNFVQIDCEEMKDLICGINLKDLVKTDRQLATGNQQLI